MTIAHNFPSDLREPQILHQFDFTSGARGLTPTQRRVLLCGAMSSAGTATAGTPVQVFDETDADTKGGKGSQVALMARKAMETARRVQAQVGGGMPEIWLLPIADPAGTAKTSTLTVTGTATSGGEIRISVHGEIVSIPVASGDVQDTVAGRIEDYLDAKYAEGVLAMTFGVTTNVVTGTAVIADVNGEDIAIAVLAHNRAPAGVAVAVAAGATGAGRTDPTTALDNALTRRYGFVAVAGHAAADIADLSAARASAVALKQFGHGVVGERGTLSTATTLASGEDDHLVCVVGCEDMMALPYQAAAAFAAMQEPVARPNFNYDGVRLPLAPPVAESSDWTSGSGGEVETALAGGVTPLRRSPEGNELQMIRAVTTQTTVSSAPFENLRDVSNSKAVYWGALQIDARLTIAFANANIEEDTPADVAGEIYDVLKAAEQEGVFRDVDAFLPQLLAEIDSSSPTRIVAVSPEAVVQQLHQIGVVHRMFTPGQ